jgi:hypothetical protein
MRIAVLVSAAGFAAGATAAEGQPAPSQETHVIVGAALGSGSARFKQNGRTVSFEDFLQGSSDKTPLLAVKVVSVGIGLTPNLYAGLDLSGVAQEGSIPGNSNYLQISNYFAALSYFPWDTGLFLKGGGGVSTFTIDVGSQSVRATGAGALLGAGYALKLSGSHHLTLSFEQTWQWYSSSDPNKPDSSQTSVFYLGYLYRI